MRWFTVDHRTPLSRGGTHADENLAGCCNDCNHKKGWLTEEEFRDRLKNGRPPCDVCGCRMSFPKVIPTCRRCRSWAKDPFFPLDPEARARTARERREEARKKMIARLGDTETGRELARQWGIEIPEPDAVMQ